MMQTSAQERQRTIFLLLKPIIYNNVLFYRFDVFLTNDLL